MHKYLIRKPYLVKAAPLCSAGFGKKISTPALRLGSIFFPKALPVSPAKSGEGHIKKPGNGSCRKVVSRAEKLKPIKNGN